MEQCPKAMWCDLGVRPHIRHEQTLITLAAVTQSPGSQLTMTCQLIVTGIDDDNVRPVVALVNHRLDQWSCMLSWEQAIQLAAQIRAAAERFQA